MVLLSDFSAVTLWQVCGSWCEVTWVCNWLTAKCRPPCITLWVWWTHEKWEHVLSFCWSLSSQLSTFSSSPCSTSRPTPTASYIVSICHGLLSICCLSGPSVLWRCQLGGRKGIWPVKNWVVGCWHGYLSGARCRLAYGPADATATVSVAVSLISLIYYRLLTAVNLSDWELFTVHIHFKKIFDS